MLLGIVGWILSALASGVLVVGYYLVVLFVISDLVAVVLTVGVIAPSLAVGLAAWWLYKRGKPFLAFGLWAGLVPALWIVALMTLVGLVFTYDP